MSKHSFYLFLAGITAIIIQSCSHSSTVPFFSKKTPRENYESRLEKDSGRTNPSVNAWLSAASNALLHPLKVPAGYYEEGKFTRNTPSATSLKFFVRRGQKLQIDLAKSGTRPFTVFMDIWREQAASGSTEHIASSDTSFNQLNYVAEQDENLVVRFQAALGNEGEYSISTSTSGSFAFPIGPDVKSNVGSFWGDGRENGARKHEGIDIFSARRSPVVAVADGHITSVGENRLGGKVIFLNPSGTNYNVYYAHLDEQLVHVGQKVVEGEVIGRTGNTGNAKNTAPHLHFGIYTSSGAIDPIAFVARKQPSLVKTVYNDFQYLMFTKKQTKVYVDLSAPLQAITTLDKNIPLYTEASYGSYFRVALPDGRKAFVDARSLSAKGIKS